MNLLFAALAIVVLESGAIGARDEAACVLAAIGLISLGVGSRRSRS